MALMYTVVPPVVLLILSSVSPVPGAAGASYANTTSAPDGSAADKVSVIVLVRFATEPISMLVIVCSTAAPPPAGSTDTVKSSMAAAGASVPQKPTGVITTVLPPGAKTASLARDIGVGLTRSERHGHHASGHPLQRPATASRENRLLSACRNLPCESVRLSPAAGGNRILRPLPPPGVVDYRFASVLGLLRPAASRELCTDWVMPHFGAAASPDRQRVAGGRQKLA